MILNLLTVCCKGLCESKLNHQISDANSTLRLTSGKVSSLPADERNDANQQLHYHGRYGKKIQKRRS
jgi:hypothetical protein